MQGTRNDSAVEITPVFKQAVEVYEEINRAIIAIDKELRLALKGHDILPTYVGLYEYLTQLRDHSEILGSDLRSQTPSIIKKYFANTQKLLKASYFDSSLIEKDIKLSDRKIELLDSLLVMYQELVYCKHKLITLVPPEFMEAEKKISQIQLKQDQRFGSGSFPLSVSSAVLPANILQILEASVAEEVGKYTDFTKQSHDQFKENIHAKIFAFQQRYNLIVDEIDLKQQTLKERIQALEKEKPKSVSDCIKKLSSQLNELNKALKQIDAAHVLDNAQRLEVDITGEIEQVERELNGLLAQEKQAREAYNAECNAMLQEQDQLNALIAQHAASLEEELSAIAAIKAPELQNNYRNLDGLSGNREAQAQISALRGRSAELQRAMQSLEDEFRRVNEIYEHCAELTRPLARFNESGLDPIVEMFANLAKLLKDVCKAQTTQIIFLGNKAWESAGIAIDEQFQILQKQLGALKESAAKQKDTANSVLDAYLKKPVDNILKVLKSQKLMWTGEISRLDGEIIPAAERSLQQIRDNLNHSLGEVFKSIQRDMGEQLQNRDKMIVDLRASISKLQPSAHVLALVNIQDRETLRAKAQIDKKLRTIKVGLGQRMESLRQARQAKNRSEMAVFVEFVKVRSALDSLKKRYIDAKPELEAHQDLRRRFESLEREYDKDFRLENNACCFRYLKPYQQLLEEVKVAVKPQKNAEKEQQRREAAQRKRVVKEPQQLPGKPDRDPSPDVEAYRVERKRPGFFKRHFGKFLGAAIGFFVGAGAGAIIGAIFAPLTFGLSIVVGALIGGAIGAVAFGSVGVGIGAGVDKQRSNKRKREEVDRERGEVEPERVIAKKHARVVAAEPSLSILIPVEDDVASHSPRRADLSSRGLSSSSQQVTLPSSSPIPIPISSGSSPSPRSYMSGKAYYGSPKESGTQTLFAHPSLQKQVPGQDFIMDFKRALIKEVYKTMSSNKEYTRNLLMSADKYNYDSINASLRYMFEHEQFVAVQDGIQVLIKSEPYKARFDGAVNSEKINTLEELEGFLGATFRRQPMYAM